VSTPLLGDRSLPPSGLVAGIDIGFSKTRYSSAICKLWWDQHKVGWSIRRYRATESERENTFREMLGGAKLRTIALDGPVRGGFDIIDQYRVAERNLTKLLQSKIGKPGQSNSPVGRRLNEETNLCAKLALSVAQVCIAKHLHGIHQNSVVEAFPNSFLGLMISDPDNVVAVRSRRSDVFFKKLVENGKLKRLIEFLLPDRVIIDPLDQVLNHDDRAALICAITAVGVATGNYCVVGDPKNGWIILPPHQFIEPWAEKMLIENGKTDRSYWRPSQS
jgi:hypothetical protein